MKMTDLKKFLNKIGIEPKNPAIYAQALTHLSAVSSNFDSYERLEFLGDSVIGMIISDFLFRTFPGKEEGELTRVKATVVSREVLGEKARQLGFEKFLAVDTARVREGGVAEFSILSDCFEAVTGALLIDRGYRMCRKFVLQHLKDECMAMRDSIGPTDHKSRLQEMWQEKYKEPPEYTIVDQTGPDHSRTFTIEVRYKKKVLGRGAGTSKKKAEQDAAHDALEKIKRKSKN